MAIPVFVLGHSGSGKSFSLHNFDPNDVGIINVVGKPLPFRNGKNFTANIQTDNPHQICDLLVKSTKPIMVIDDFQYIMANEFMRESNTKGFDKFTQIGRHAWDIFNVMNYHMKPYQRVYVLAHTDVNESGVTKMKTVGRLLDEKITPEGLVTIVLQTHIENGQNYFMTQNNGSNTVKTPFEMFDDRLIPNDLNAVDDAICEYYGLSKTLTETQPAPEVAA